MTKEVVYRVEGPPDRCPYRVHKTGNVDFPQTWTPKSNLKRPICRLRRKKPKTHQTLYSYRRTCGFLQALVYRNPYFHVGTRHTHHPWYHLTGSLYDEESKSDRDGTSLRPSHNGLEGYTLYLFLCSSPSTSLSLSVSVSSLSSMTLKIYNRVYFQFFYTPGVFYKDIRCRPIQTVSLFKVKPSTLRFRGTNQWYDTTKPVESPTWRITPETKIPLFDSLFPPCLGKEWQWLSETI